MKTKTLYTEIDGTYIKVPVDVVVSDMRKGGFRTEERAWLWLRSLRAGIGRIDPDTRIPHNWEGTEIVYGAVSAERRGAPGWF